MNHVEMLIHVARSLLVNSTDTSYSSSAPPFFFFLEYSIMQTQLMGVSYFLVRNFVRSVGADLSKHSTVQRVMVLQRGFDPRTVNVRSTLKFKCIGQYSNTNFVLLYWPMARASAHTSHSVHYSTKGFIVTRIVRVHVCGCDLSSLFNGAF